MQNLSKNQILEAYSSQDNKPKPVLGDFFEKVELSQAEKVFILSTFNRDATGETHPVLDLSRQKLTSIPPEIAIVDGPKVAIEIDGKTISYREIDLSYNKALTTLSKDDLKILNNFSAIHLAGINIKELPLEVNLLTNPIVLNFSWSDLESLPDEIYELTQLRSLRLNWTKIANFSEKISNLTNLADIEMSETPFLSTLYRIREKGSATTDEERKVKKICQILDDIGCSIEE